MKNCIKDKFRGYCSRPYLRISGFSSTQVRGSVTLPVINDCKDGSFQKSMTFENTKWAISGRTMPVRYNPDAVDICMTFKLVKGRCENVNVGLSMEFNGWSRDNYVLLPAAAYNGNRFKSRRLSYSPKLKEPLDIKPDAPIIITDVPRLEIDGGLSRIYLMTRDLSTPAAGFYNPAASQGFWLLTEQGTKLGEYGISIEESKDREWAVISLFAPGVRENCRYRICDNRYPSSDRGADFNEGSSVDIHMRLYFFRCNEIQELFDYFTGIRKDLTGEVKLSHNIPFYSTWNIQEDKYNRENWVEKYGYYRVGTEDNIYSYWQSGWVGGMMASYALLFAGNDDSRQRALRNLDFIFPGGQGDAGFFYSCGNGIKWYGDNVYSPKGANWHLIRRSGDTLYYILKQFMLLEKQNPRIELPEKWKTGAIRCADAFVRLWNERGQFGQFVDVETGDIIVGNSTSGGIVPAALALAGQYFDRSDYTGVSLESAYYYYENFVKKGITCGGPGDACQCPDSESAFGLLESFVVLYEVSGEKCWIKMAEDMANQCFTWCVSYDFRFPPESTFGHLDMKTAGTVYANVQNKHSAPGICTHSGVSLFKLYRATGKIRYLELIREIAHNLPQYLSREDRPIQASNGKAMPAGWMNERVEMSDWLEPVGEIFYGSCWCEVSNMLTYIEIPGLYVQTDTSFVYAIDHIEARVVENNSKKLIIEVSNPTDFEAYVKVLSEKSAEMCNVLGQNALFGCRCTRLGPKSGKQVLFEK